MEVLSCLLSAAVNEGLLEGFKVGNVTVSRLLFAYDTLIFCKACPDQLAHLPGIFLLFEAASGLKVNLAKSVLIFVGSVQQVDSLVSILGCEVATMLVKYLGLPLGGPHNVTHIWDGVIEKIERCMAGWKWSLLSKGGRVTLIKSILANTPLGAAFFTWTAALGKILTSDNLRKRRAIVINRCCMCKRDGESVDHRLIHCDVTSALWSTIFSCFGLAWVMPRRVPIFVQVGGPQKGRGVP
jgi:hypothetical protein